MLYGERGANKEGYRSVKVVGVDGVDGNKEMIYEKQVSAIENDIRTEDYMKKKSTGQMMSKFCGIPE